MGVFDGIKNKYQDHQGKVAELKQTRGDKLASLPIEYIGGHQKYRSKSNGTIKFYQNQVEFKGLPARFTIINGDIDHISIEGQQEVTRRVTVTRLLATGIFAFALKKKKEEKDAYISIVLKDGQEIIFHAKGRSPMELRAKLSQAIAKFKPQERTQAI